MKKDKLLQISLLTIITFIYIIRNNHLKNFMPITFELRNGDQLFR
jgi:hypothetical protein